MITKASRLIGTVVGIALLVSGCSGTFGLLDGLPSEQSRAESADLAGPSRQAISSMSTEVLFDSSPSAVQTPSVSVLGFGRTGTHALGDRIALEPGGRSLSEVRVTFGSWAKPSSAETPQTAAHAYPIRVTLYAAGGADAQTPGAELASETEWVAIPWHEGGTDGPSDCASSAMTPVDEAAAERCGDATYFTAAFDINDRDRPFPAELIYRIELAPEAVDGGRAELADPSSFGPAVVSTAQGAAQPARGTDLDPRTIFWAAEMPESTPARGSASTLFQRSTPDAPITGAVRILGTER
jgi:hypothetical protein